MFPPHGPECIGWTKLQFLNFTILYLLETKNCQPADSFANEYEFRTAFSVKQSCRHGILWIEVKIIAYISPIMERDEKNYREG